MKLLLTMCSLLLTAVALAQGADAPAVQAHVRFALAKAPIEPTAYALEVNEDGTARYIAGQTTSDTPEAAGQVIHVDGPLLTELFTTARTHHYFAMSCEASHNRVAFTGEKTLAYSGPDGSGSCTFNYAHEQSLNKAAADLMAVAYTLEVGARLASEHLHDRLSLDSELESLQEAVQDRRALAIENIEPQLKSIANDDAVMNRARGKARALLSESSSTR